MTELRTPYQVKDLQPKPIYEETLSLDEYQLLRRLRQLKAKRAEIAVVIFNPAGMKVRELGE